MFFPFSVFYDYIIFLVDLQWINTLWLQTQLNLQYSARKPQPVTAPIVAAPPYPRGRDKQSVAAWGVRGCNPPCDNSPHLADKLKFTVLAADKL